MKLFKKYIIPLIICLLTILIFYLCTKQLILSTFICLSLNTLLLRVFDDLIDYDLDLKNNKVIFKRTTLVLMFFIIIMLILLNTVIFKDFSGFIITFIIIFILVCAFKYKKLAFFKIFIFPILIVYLLLNVDFIYLITISLFALLISIAYFIYKTKRRK